MAMLMLLLASCGKTVKCESVDIVPRPLSVEMQDGTYKLRLAKGECVCKALDNIPVTDDKTLGNEAYTLTITKQGIAIAASTPAGAFYARQSLRQMIPAEALTDKKVTAVVLPCCIIKDAPHFAYRGAHLDVCRHFFSVDEVKTYLDILAMHKINRFHFHLTEDQGWRIEIKHYPQLTQVGAYRDGTMVGKNWNSDDGVRYGGFYTQDEVKEIVK